MRRVRAKGQGQLRTLDVHGMVRGKEWARGDGRRGGQRGQKAGHVRHYKQEEKS